MYSCRISTFLGSVAQFRKVRVFDIKLEAKLLQLNLRDQISETISDYCSEYFLDTLNLELCVVIFAS